MVHISARGKRGNSVAHGRKKPSPLTFVYNWLTSFFNIDRHSVNN
jgi:hypothetical protein